MNNEQKQFFDSLFSYLQNKDSQIETEVAAFINYLSFISLNLRNNNKIITNFIDSFKSDLQFNKGTPFTINNLLNNKIFIETITKENIANFILENKVKNINNDIIESLYKISIEQLKQNQLENDSFFEKAIKSVVDKYSINRPKLSQIMEEMTYSINNKRRPFESLSLAIDGKYGNTSNLVSSDGQLFKNITNLLEDITNKYSTAQKSLKNKIIDIEELQTKLGIEIIEFKM